MTKLKLTVALAALAVVALGSPAVRADHDTCPYDDCVDVEVPVPVELGLDVPDAHVRILLPPTYHHPVAVDERYPVLYLLHGAGDTYATWTQNTDVEEFVADPEIVTRDVIVVMPDGGANTEAGWYSDWFDGSREWESFHIDVLIPWIDTNFRTLAAREHRAIAGLSMGGFGAMSYAARHPHLFGAAAAFSGAVDTMLGWPASGMAFDALGPYMGTPQEEVWGHQVFEAANWRAHNPTDLAGELADVELYLTWGDGTPRTPGDQPDPVEFFIDQMNDSFTSALRSADVDYAERFVPGERHHWPFWEDALRWALPQIVARIG